MKKNKETFMNTIYQDGLHYLVDSFSCDEKMQQGRWSIYSFGYPLGVTDFSVSKSPAGDISFEIGKYTRDNYYRDFVINKDNLFQPCYDSLLGDRNHLFIWRDPANREKFLRISRKEQSFIVSFKGFSEDEEHIVRLPMTEQLSPWEKLNMEKLNDFLMDLNQKVDFYNEKVKPRLKNKRI